MAFSKSHNLKSTNNLEGWLYKRGPKGVGMFSWRKRYFKQKNECLFYYKTEDDPVEYTLGYIPLNEASSVHPTLNSDKQYAFQINTTTRVYYLYCNSEDEQNYWITGLVRYIKQSGIEKTLELEEQVRNPEKCFQLSRPENFQHVQKWDRQEGKVLVLNEELATHETLAIPSNLTTSKPLPTPPSNSPQIPRNNLPNLPSKPLPAPPSNSPQMQRNKPFV